MSLTDVLAVGRVEARGLLLGRPAVGRVKGPAAAVTEVERALGPVEVGRRRVAPLGRVAAEDARFPRHREPLEGVLRHLVVGGVAGLPLGREHRRPADRPAARREDAARALFPENPENLVEPVDADVAEVAVGVIQVLAEAARVDAAGARTLVGPERVAAVEGAQGRGAAPEVPVELGGHRHRGQRLLGRAAAEVEVAADHPDGPKEAAAEQVARRLQVRGGAAVRPDLDHPVVRARRPDHRPAFANGVRGGLLHVHVRPRLHGGDRGQRVPVVGGGDDDDFRPLAREQLAVIAVVAGGVAGEGPKPAAGGGERAGVDVAEADDLAGAAGDGLGEDVATPPAGADQGGAEAAARGITRAEGADRGRQARGEARVEKAAPLHHPASVAGPRPAPSPERAGPRRGGTVTKS